MRPWGAAFCAVSLFGSLAGCGGDASPGAAGNAGSGGGATTGNGGTTGAAGSGAGGTGTAGTSGAGGAGGAGTAGTTGGAGTGAGGSAAGGSGTGGGAAGGRGGAGGGAGTSGATGSGGRGGSGTAGAAGGAGASGRGGAAGGTAGAGGRGGSAGGGASGAAGALASTSLAVRFANSVLSRWPDPNNITATAGWEYNHGIVLRGIEQVYRHTNDARYLAYIQKYTDEYVSSSGAVTITAPTMHSFDNMQPSIFLPFLYQQTGLAKYHTAADQIRARYDSIPRNADQGFWHKQTYPNQMWLDSIYMGEPFLMRYSTVFGTCGTFCSDTVVQQVTLIGAHVRDSATGLFYHAWDDSPAGMKAAWANATTGRSPSVWGRALGWYAMSLVDMLPDLPASTGRDQMLTYLQGLAAALKADQDPATGLWYQVVDQGSKSDDWLETSGSGMFVYALKVAVDRGYIDASYLTVAQKGWQGLQTKVTTDASGVPSFTGAVGGMGVQNNYAGYVATTLMPLLTNSSHGLCAILLAASEMEAQ